MGAAAFALSAAIAAAAPSGGTEMTGRPAPDLVVSQWPNQPQAFLRNLRGRKVVLFLYHTAC
jgi:hypothetical protein